jgi:hypothetical protein
MNTIRIDKGNLYLDAEIYSLYFAGHETIALLQSENGFLILPVHNQASGGRLMKLRNSKGDRVITATDFLEQCGVGYDHEVFCPAKWDSGMSALFVELPVLLK